MLVSPENRASGWKTFWDAMNRERLTVWGLAIDTLENTSRFALNESTGPMVVLHVFDQPLILTSPYEAYMGALTVPAKVVETAVRESLAIHYLTPREILIEAIHQSYPNLRNDNIHVWTLGGKKRAERLRWLGDQWKKLGVHLVDDGWKLPSGLPVFTDSGTYAPVYCVGTYEDGGEQHLFLTDGYASTAEALQAASLDPIRRQKTFLCPLPPGSKFDSLPKGAEIMRLDPRLDSVDLRRKLAGILGCPCEEADAEAYRALIVDADRANLPRNRPILTIDDFLPNKAWNCLAVTAAICDDPYSGMPGVRRVEVSGDNLYHVTVRVADTGGRERRVTLTLGFSGENREDIVTPLIDRLCKPNAYETRAVKSSDIGRIVNELRTWSWNSVSDVKTIGPDGDVQLKVSINLDRVDEVVISAEKRRAILRILKNYIRDYPGLAQNLILQGQLAEEA